MEEVSSYKLASVIARVLDDKKGQNISILNIENVSVLADFFVICSADTTIQVRALTEIIRESIKKNFDRFPLGQENDTKNRWNLLDYGDVIVHILHKEERETYAIEKFWNHALKVNKESWMEASKKYSMYN